jgi:transcriptional regulator with XRE-family HTH domain
MKCLVNAVPVKGEPVQSEPQLTTMGARVRYVRKNLALTQTELAKLAGVTQPVISDLEANRTHTSGRTASIAAALGVKALWLETGHSETDNLAQEAVNNDMLIIPVIAVPGNCGARSN